MKGESVDFFNKQALTTTLPAQLAIKFKIPVVPVYIERNVQNNFKIEFLDEIRPSNFKNKFELTEKLNQVMEEMISKILINGFGHIIGGNKSYFFKSLNLSLASFAE